MANKIQLGKIPQLFIRKTLFGLEKPEIDRTHTQLMKPHQESLLIRRSDRADVDGATVAQ